MVSLHGTSSADENEQRTDAPDMRATIGRLIGETAARACRGFHDARLAWARELFDVLDSARMREAAVCHDREAAQLSQPRRMRWVALNGLEPRHRGSPPPAMMQLRRCTFPAFQRLVRHDGIGDGPPG